MSASWPGRAGCAGRKTVMNTLRPPLGGDRPALTQLTKGIHLVVARERLPLDDIVVMNAADKRLVFVVPHGEIVWIGTTDTFYPKPEERPRITREDVDYLLHATNLTWPEAKITDDDIRGAWGGGRPPGAQAGRCASEISRRDAGRRGECACPQHSGTSKRASPRPRSRRPTRAPRRRRPRRPCRPSLSPRGSTPPAAPCTGNLPARAANPTASVHGSFRAEVPPLDGPDPKRHPQTGAQPGGDHSGRPYRTGRLVGATHASWRACMGCAFPQRAPRESHATGGSLGIVWVERPWGAPSPGGPRASPTRPKGAWESGGSGDHSGRPYACRRRQAFTARGRSRIHAYTPARSTAPSMP